MRRSNRECDREEKKHLTEEDEQKQTKHLVSALGVCMRTEQITVSIPSLVRLMMKQKMSIRINMMARFVAMGQTVLRREDRRGSSTAIMPFEVWSIKCPDPLCYFVWVCVYVWGEGLWGVLGRGGRGLFRPWLAARMMHWNESKQSNGWKYGMKSRKRQKW